WWLRKGIMPSFSGVVDKWGEDDYVTYKLDEIRRRLKDHELDALTLGVVEFEEDWGRFLIWVEDHVHNLDEYLQHFREVPAPAIRHTGGKWELRVWSWDDSPLPAPGAGPWGPFTGGFNQRWVQHPYLTRIMDQVRPRMIQGTKDAIARLWAKREPLRTPSNQQVSVALPARGYGALAARFHMRVADLRPTNRARFQTDLDQKLFSHFDPEKQIIGKHFRRKWLTEDPYLMVFDNFPAPPGFVLVSGANYNSYASIRSRDTFSFDPAKTVELPNPSTDPDTGLKLSRYNDEQRRAHEDVLAGRASKQYDEDGTGRVVYWGWGPNVWGVGLVRVSDLVFEGVPSAPTNLRVQ
ncbi:MAG: hypothetical protein ACE5JD_17155, partial [Candidatus Methylomirabilia bacterium]